MLFYISKSVKPVILNYWDKIKHGLFLSLSTVTSETSLENQEPNKESKHRKYIKLAKHGQPFKSDFLFIYLFQFNVLTSCQSETRIHNLALSRFNCSLGQSLIKLSAT